MSINWVATTTDLIVGIVVGVIVLLICLIPCVIGMSRQIKSRNFDPVLYGEMPTCAIVFQAIFMIVLALGCILYGISYYFFVLLIIAGVIHLIRICYVCCGVREAGAFNNSRNAAQTSVFLESLRQKTPTISLYIRCWHTEYYYDSQGHRQSRTVTTFTQTRYIGITAWYDKTPSMYVNGNAALVYLKLNKCINWIGQSQMILEWHRNNAYQQNMYRDTNCSVSASTAVPGLTEDNFLRMGIVPNWMNEGLFKTSIAFGFDVCFLCYLRAFVPSTFLNVVKYVSLEPQGMSYQQMPTHVDMVQPPPPMQVNDLPLVSDIRPPDFNINVPNQMQQQQQQPMQMQQNTVQMQPNQMQGQVMQSTQQYMM